jgi:hypothetical protein
MLNVAAHSKEAVSIKVTPAVARAPASVRIEAMVEADDENRELQVVAESESFSRASRISLDGSRSPRLNEFIFRDLPDGDYEIRVTVIGASGPRASGGRGLHVLR